MAITWNSDAEETHIAKLFPKLIREGIVFVSGFCKRSNSLISEFFNTFSELARVLQTS